MKITHYPNSILLSPTAPVLDFNRDLRNEIFLMFKLMRQERGIGLAANQAGICKSMFIMEVPIESEGIRRRTFINPQIKLSGEVVMLEEGCLSFPDIRLPISRHTICEITYQNLFKQSCTETFTDISAIVCQHEMDHLLGKTFLDYLPELTKQAIHAKLVKHDTSK